jgi:hypothetical protein
MVPLQNFSLPFSSRPSENWNSGKNHTKIQEEGSRFEGFNLSPF